MTLTTCDCENNSKKLAWSIPVKHGLPDPGKRILIQTEQYQTIGFYVPGFWLESDGDLVDYDEERDTYYIKEGWYEDCYGAEAYYQITDHIKGYRNLLEFTE